MTMGKIELVKNAAYYGIVPSIPKIVNIFLLPILTAHLTSQDYGIAGTIIAYTSAFAAISTLGCAAFITSSFYRYGSRYIKIWKQIYGLLQYWMIFFAILQAFLLYFIIPDEAAENKWAIIFLTNFNNVLFGPSALIGSSYYRLQQQPKPVVYRSLLGGLITSFANLYLIAYLELGYMGWYISSFAGTLVVNASYWFVLNFKLEMQPDYLLNKNVIKHTLRVSLPTIPHFFSTYLINGSNKFLMDRYKVPIGQIGKFNFASEFFSYFQMYADAINHAISPMFMQSMKDGKAEESCRLFKQCMCFFVIAVSLFVIWSREIFGVMVRNEELSGCYYLASVLVAGFIHRPVYLAVTSAMYYYERTTSLMKITLSTSFGAFVLYAVFIPFYGIWSAAVITYLALTLMGYLGVMLPSNKHLYKLPYKSWQIFLFLNGVVLLSLALIATPIIIKGLMTFIIIVLMFFYYRQL